MSVLRRPRGEWQSEWVSVCVCNTHEEKKDSPFIRFLNPLGWFLCKGLKRGERKKEREREVKESVAMPLIWCTKTGLFFPYTGTTYRSLFSLVTTWRKPAIHDVIPGKKTLSPSKPSSSSSSWSWNILHSHHHHRHKISPQSYVPMLFPHMKIISSMWKVKLHFFQLLLLPLRLLQFSNFSLQYFIHWGLSSLKISEG